MISRTIPYFRTPLYFNMKKMKKILAFMLAFTLALPAFADEGMWLPILLGRNFDDMKAHGLQLTKEELYDVNNGSLKDAIVSLGGFCTGEVISDKGLMLTNHHCGFSAIQSHSTVDHDYLTDGFWAKSLAEELPNEGLFVRFLVRMEDVTNRVMEELNADMSEDERNAKIREIGKTIADEATAENHYEADVKTFFHGNEFYLFVYEKFDDVRLVGAPPSSVGKYGGDTDNWMWPRHTGDFSMFRIYSAPDGSPATYAEENIPLKPKHHLPISLTGVKDGDFTMIFGYPGSTDRYLSSYGVKQAIDKYNPTVVKIRDARLAIMRKYMDADPAVRIQYASKYARVANYWKYYIGQTEQLKNNHVADKKMAIEKDFASWASANAGRKAKYGETLNLLKEGYEGTDEYVVGNVYVLEAGLTGSDIALFSFRMGRLIDAYDQTEDKLEEALKAAETDEDKEAAKAQYAGRLEAIKAQALSMAEEHFKDYNVALDKELLAATAQMYIDNVAEDKLPEVVKTVKTKYKSGQKFADRVFKKSKFTNLEDVKAVWEKPDDDILEKDPAVVYGLGLFERYRNAAGLTKESEDKLEKGYRLFTAGLREMNPDKNYAPDANSTMRVTYGNVGSYDPRDGVHYKYYTTADGILEKMDNNDPEFVVPARLEKLIKEEDFGRYTNSKGELPVCFIHNTDITGGNSGSPVINGKGHLIGTAFDGNWEAMSGDIFFEKDLQRTISVDVRYTLFIIDKYAGATNLINEMTLVTEKEDKGAETEMAPATKENATTDRVMK